MITDIVQNCIQTALSDAQIIVAIEQRNKTNDFKFHSIHAAVVRRDDALGLLGVRVMLDFDQRIDNDSRKEDIIIDVVYDSRNSKYPQTYNVISRLFVPEI